MGDGGTSAVQSIASRLGLSVSSFSVLASASRAGQVFVLHILEDALTLMSVDHRDRLSVRDINDSLAVQRQEPLLGYSSSRAPETATFTYSAGQDLIVYRDSTHRIDHFTNTEQCQYQHRPTFDCIWVFVENSFVASAPPPPDAAPHPPEKSNPELRYVSRKLREYFHKVIELFHRDGQEFEATLSFMARSTAISALLPHFLDFITSSLKAPCDPPRDPRTLVKLARVLVANDSFNIIESVETLVSIALTILFLPNSQGDLVLGEDIAELFQGLCDKYGSVFTRLRPRIAEELLKGILEDSCDSASLCGALGCFLSLGIETITFIFIPQLPHILRKAVSPLVTDAIARVLGLVTWNDRVRLLGYGHLPLETSSLAWHRAIADVLGGQIAEFDACDDVWL
jgi:hypothetical protein